MADEYERFETFSNTTADAVRSALLGAVGEKRPGPLSDADKDPVVDALEPHLEGLREDMDRLIRTHVENGSLISAAIADARSTTDYRRPTIKEVGIDPSSIGLTIKMPKEGATATPTPGVVPPSHTTMKTSDEKVQKQLEKLLGVSKEGIKAYSKGDSPTGPIGVTGSPGPAPGFDSHPDFSKYPNLLSSPDKLLHPELLISPELLGSSLDSKIKAGPEIGEIPPTESGFKPGSVSFGEESYERRRSAFDKRFTEDMGHSLAEELKKHYGHMAKQQVRYLERMYVNNADSWWIQDDELGLIFDRPWVDGEGRVYQRPSERFAYEKNDPFDAARRAYDERNLRNQYHRSGAPGSNPELAGNNIISKLRYGLDLSNSARDMMPDLGWAKETDRWRREMRMIQARTEGMNVEYGYGMFSQVGSEGRELQNQFHNWSEVAESQRRSGVEYSAIAEAWRKNLQLGYRDAKATKQMVETAAAASTMIGSQLEATTEYFRDMHMSFQLTNMDLGQMRISMQRVSRDTKLTGDALLEVANSAKQVLRTVEGSGGFNAVLNENVMRLMSEFQKSDIQEQGTQTIQAMLGLKDYLDASDDTKHFLLMGIRGNEKLYQMLESGLLLQDTGAMKEFSQNLRKSMSEIALNFTTQSQRVAWGISQLDTDGNEIMLRDFQTGDISKMDPAMRSQLDMQVFTQTGLRLKDAQKQIDAIAESYLTLNDRIARAGKQFAKGSDLYTKEIERLVSQQRGIAIGQIGSMVNDLSGKSFDDIIKEFGPESTGRKNLVAAMQELQSVGQLTDAKGKNVIDNLNTDAGFRQGMIAMMSKAVQETGGDQKALQRAIMNGNKDELVPLLTTVMEELQAQDVAQLKAIDPMEQSLKVLQNIEGYVKEIAGKFVEGGVNMLGSGILSAALVTGFLLSSINGLAIAVVKGWTLIKWAGKGIGKTIMSVGRGFLWIGKQLGRLGRYLDNFKLFRFLGKKAGPLSMLANIGFGIKDFRAAQKALAEGEITAEEASRRKGAAVGSMGLSIAGGVAGAALGTLLAPILGPLGPILGATVGSIVGDWIGSTLGRFWPEIKNALIQTFTYVKNFIVDIFSFVSNKIKSLFGWESETDKQVKKNQERMHSEGVALAYNDKRNPLRDQRMKEVEVERKLSKESKEIGRAISTKNFEEFSKRIDASLRMAIDSRRLIQGEDQWSNVIKSVESARRQGHELSPETQMLYDQLVAMRRFDTERGLVASELTRKGIGVGIGGMTKPDFDSLLMKQTKDRLIRQGFNPDGSKKQEEMAKKALEPGSIYVHDIHVEKLLNKIIGLENVDSYNSLIPATGEGRFSEVGYDDVVGSFVQASQEQSRSEIVQSQAISPIPLSDIHDRIQQRYEAVEPDSSAAMTMEHLGDIANTSERQTELLSQLVHLMSQVAESLRPMPTGDGSSGRANTKSRIKPAATTNYYQLAFGIRDSANKGYVNNGH